MVAKNNIVMLEHRLLCDFGILLRWCSKLKDIAIKKKNLLPFPSIGTRFLRDYIFFKKGIKLVLNTISFK